MHALMPWLLKYRILARPEDNASQHPKDLENRYPSLRFKSLHNVFALTEDENEEDSPKALGTVASRRALFGGIAASKNGLTDGSHRTSTSATPSVSVISV